uniref:TPR repeat-containing protein n=1 Tax=Cyanothece sp. (strain PCC 7425 / ATCC 29141) TaxID=395961 RepID=B8HKX4_CYAP4
MQFLGLLLVTILGLSACFEHPGSYHHPISTQSQLVQRYFDQGLVLAYGFDYERAFHSFESAVKLDPDCAICYWGMAYVLRPNLLNTRMDHASILTSWDALQQAIALIETASPAEQAYIRALAQRHSAQTEVDRTALKRSYANAMEQVAHQYPDDLDAATLYAESLMDLSAGDYWEADGQLKPIGRKLLGLLDAVLERNPEHPGALHFYIHVVEKQHPEWGITIADRLRALQIPTGHLLHMPSHIYLRVGRYEDAILVNQQATERDRANAQIFPQSGIYTLAHRLHNLHFLWYVATLSGQQEQALTAADQIVKLIDTQVVRQPGYGAFQHYLMLPLFTLLRFGMWREVLHQPAPDLDLIYPTGIWHYARGMAQLARGDGEAAREELEKLQAIAANPTLNEVTLWGINSTADLLQISTKVLSGELAAKQGKTAQALALLKQAVQLEDQLSYDEPPSWPLPVRPSLAAVLLANGEPAAAEQLYRQDLALYPNNPWSLNGLARVRDLQDQIGVKTHLELEPVLESPVYR